MFVHTLFIRIITVATFCKRATVFLFCYILISCSNGDVIDDDGYQWADQIFQNGKIYTVDDQNPWAEAVAIKGEEIIFVGNAQDVEAYYGPETIVHNLDGRVMMPGFIDSHMHAVLGGGYVNALSLDVKASPEEWIEAIGDYAAEHSELPVIFGFGFDSAAFGTSEPTKEMIDAVVSDRPVFIMDEGFHTGWSNSKAMERLAITKETEDPNPGFDYYKRDKNGAPTGWYFEGTSTTAMRDLNVWSVESVAEGTVKVFDIMNSYGITSVYDAGYFEVSHLAQDVLKYIDENDLFSVRFVGSQLISSPDQVEGALDKLETQILMTSDKGYNVRVLKILNDGTVEARSAGMFEDYQGEPGNHGSIMLAEEELTTVVIDAAERGVDVHIHALGERTVHEALNAIEAAQGAYGESDSRYTICHIQLMAREDVERFAKLNVIAQSTPLWTSYDDLGKQYVSEDQFNRYYLFKSLKDAGVRLSFGSDYPSSGAGELGMSPIYNIEIGHTRQYAGQSGAPIQPPIDERLDVPSLIRGYTYDAAYQLHMEQEIGSIKEGKKADFVILNQNPFEADTYKIHKIEVDMTMKGGKVVYER